MNVRTSIHRESEKAHSRILGPWHEGSVSGLYLLVRYARFRQLLQELRFEVAGHTSDLLHILPQGRKGYEAAYTIHWRSTPREGRSVYFVDHLLSPLVWSDEVKRDVEVGLHGDQVGHSQ